LICKHCGQDNNILNESCEKCGKSLSFLTNRSFSSSFSKPKTTVPSKKNIWSSRDLLRFAGSKLYESNPYQFDFGESEESVRQTASFVFANPHVQTNVMYQQRAEQTSFVYLHEEPVFNAFATDHQISEIGASPPMIILFGGIVHAIRIASLGLGSRKLNDNDQSRKKLIEIIRWVGAKIFENRGQFDESDFHEALDQFGFSFENTELTRKARSYSAAICMGIIAHELGHIALGHTLKTTSDQNYEILRNQEREADSFSSSIASASPFSDYIVEGGIFWWALMAWTNNLNIFPFEGESTHPNSRERLMDYIRANKDQASAVGIDEETILECIP